MSIPRLKRREFCVITGGSIASLIIGNACRPIPQSNDGRFTARPRDGVKQAVPGQTVLGLDRDRDAILYIPKTATQAPLPLFVMLHGATQSAEDMFWYLGSAPEEAGIAVLAPNSRDTTWDAIGGGFGADVVFVNNALDRVFQTAAIAPTRIAIGGFSDGASYAIALGMINAELFKSIVAFSPGFLIDDHPHGRPRVFISHGTHDRILPINRCGRVIAGTLKSGGYDVTFREFDGDHEIPADIAREGLKWVL